MPNSVLFKVFALRAASEAGAALSSIEPGEWSHAVDEALLHQCAPMFREHLRELGLLNSLPVEVQEQLAQLTRYTAMSNLQGVHQLHELMARLNGQAPLIILKGACLARTSYRDISLRSMRDLDVLSRSENMASVGQVLRDLGYEQDRRFEETWADLHQEPTFLKDEALPVELHRSLLDKNTVFDIDYDGMWSRAVPVDDIPGLFYMAPEDQLAHVCIHAGYSHELDIGLYAFLDIAAMAQMPAFNWALFLERTVQWKATRCVFLTLRMAEILVGAEVPVEVMAALKPADFSDIVLKRGLDAVQHKLAEGHVPASLFTQLIINLFDRERLQKLPGKIKRRFLLKPEDRQTWKGTPGQTTWYGQLEPLIKGMFELVQSSAKREQLRARLNGARLRRWMESA